MGTAVGVGVGLGVGVDVGDGVSVGLGEFVPEGIGVGAGLVVEMTSDRATASIVTGVSLDTVFLQPATIVRKENARKITKRCFNNLLIRTKLPSLGHSPL
jgi:tetrahydrodipicolinate N-succinyltransferase